jgi:hypothetical protein
MRHAARFAFAILAIVALVMSGCVISKNALSDPEKAEVDPALCGVWEAADKGESIELMAIGVPPAGKLPKGFLMLRGIKFDSSKTLNVDTPMLFFVSKIGDQEYWNLIANPSPEGDTPENFLATFDFSEWLKHPKHGYMLVRCVRSKDQMTLHTMDTEATSKVVMAGKLKGDIERDQNKRVSSVTLTDSTDVLRTYLKDNAATMFTDEGKERYRRIR